MYKAHISHIIHRRNTVNGRLYKDDATIMTWQLANDASASEPAALPGPYHLQYSPNPSDPLLPWIDRISTYIRSLAPRQLISTGFEGQAR